MEQKDNDLKRNLCLCVHGHFYQPPRENPWLEVIELQKSASPYHDWNERITRECYGPNTRARLHGDRGRITGLINNYAYMSFDFGPTLLSWLEVKHPWVYSQILAADKEGQKRYNGHGNAMAQVYNHIIMPLASRRDKVTQIRWGLEDFRRRFAREAEGMWLAETAVDTESLEIMADEGIRFTVLSPGQALMVRPIASHQVGPEPTFSKQKERKSEWIDVSEGRIDPTRPYRVFLNSQRNKFIDVFFYDGPLSRAIAYEKILSSGEALLGRITGILDTHRDGPRLLSIATDGESYGHHFKFGEMALAWVFNHIENKGKIRLINYGAFLDIFTPEHEVKIVENSSWSCAHGVERWRSDCGCSVSGSKECTQHWRMPLRNGLEWLSGELALIFEKRASRLLKKPWDARDDYIKLIMDDSQKDSFFQRHSIRRLKQEEEIEALCLLESQRMALYMFTSCGWFFDDISGIESIQILMYALRSIELVRRASPNDLEKGLMEFLTQAKSNDPSYGNGARIFETMVKPSRISPSLAAAHYAFTSLTQAVDHTDNPFSRIIMPVRENRYDCNGAKAVLGEVKIIEKRTHKETLRRYLAVREKGREYSCVIESVSAPDYELINNEISKVFSESPESLITIFSMTAQDVQFFSIEDLIPDVRLAVIGSLSCSIYERIRKSLHQDGTLDELTNMLHLINEPPPPCLNNIFRLLFAEKFSGLLNKNADGKQVDFQDLSRLLELFHANTSLTPAEGKPAHSSLREMMTDILIKKTAQDFLVRSMNSFAMSQKPVIIQNMISFLKFMIPHGVDLDLWECQNIFYDTYKNDGITKTAQPQIFPVLSELGHLLGFLIEEK